MKEVVMTKNVRAACILALVIVGCNPGPSYTDLYSKYNYELQKAAAARLEWARLAGWAVRTEFVGRISSQEARCSCS